VALAGYIACMTRARGQQVSSVVTIASVRAHGVRQLLVYCRGKRAGDWPCHHEATLPVDRFADDEALAESSVAAAAQLADGVRQIFDRITVRSKRSGEVSVGLCRHDSAQGL